MEKVYKFNSSNGKLIEKIIDDDFTVINHVILEKNDALPIHKSNSNVYLVILKGAVTISLNDAQPADYEKGSIVFIPYDVKMSISNINSDLLEFFIVKSPNPRHYEK